MWFGEAEWTVRCARCVIGCACVHVQWRLCLGGAQYVSSVAISALECRRVCLASLYTTRVRRGPAGRPCVPEDLGLTCICLTMTIRHGQGPEVEGGRRLA